MAETYVRNSSAFQQATQIFVNVSGTYQEVNEAYANVSGTYKLIFSAPDPPPAPADSPPALS